MLGYSILHTGLIAVTNELIENVDLGCELVISHRHCLRLYTKKSPRSPTYSEDLYSSQKLKNM